VKICYSPRSLRDLEKIRAYLAKESGDRKVANHFIGSILDECEFLAVLPERYPVYPHAPPWRMMPFANYLVFYQVHHDEVRIGHVRHAARRPFGG
jgi:plasmid stabilization system protein ParE